MIYLGDAECLANAKEQLRHLAGGTVAQFQVYSTQLSAARRQLGGDWVECLSQPDAEYPETCCIRIAILLTRWTILTNPFWSELIFYITSGCTIIICLLMQGPRATSLLCTALQGHHEIITSMRVHGGFKGAGDDVIDVDGQWLI